jgi:autotransporter-associated beta strand protein
LLPTHRKSNLILNSINSLPNQQRFFAATLFVTTMSHNPSPTLRLMRQQRLWISSSLAGLMALWQIGQPLQAATNNWTAGSATDLLWNTTGNWSSAAAPIFTDDLIFLGIIPNPGALTNPQIITLGAGSLANSLSFKNNYTLSSGDLTLTAGSGGIISTDLGTSATISSQLLGTAGLTKTGLGTLRLTNGSNSYTGATLINQGSLVITNAAALGASTSTVSILGNTTRGASLAAPGFSGGQLVLGAGIGLGASPAGMTFSRNLAVSGGGPSGDGFALLSVGNNTLSGTIYGSAGGTTRLGTTFGTTIINGTLALQGNALTEIRGFGNTNLTGVLTGSTASAISKQGEQGTLIFNPSSVTGFSGAVGVAVGSVRVASGTSLGTSQAGSAIRLGGGTFEIRSDVASTFGTTANPNRPNLTANTTLFADRAVGSLDATKLNQTINLGLTTMNTAAATLTVNGRNGTNLTLSDVTGNDGFNYAVTNTSAGLVTINGGANSLIWDQTDSGTVRNLTFTVTGDMALNAGIAASGLAHTFTKSGTGNLNWAPGAGVSTYTGLTTINAGTVQVGGASGSALANAFSGTSAVTFNNAAVGAALNYTGTGETSAKTLNFSATTGPTFLYANQSTATAPLIYSSFGATYGAGAKTIVLGGSDTQANRIGAVIGENSGTNSTSILKTGAGSWTLSAANTNTGSLTVNRGTLILGATAGGATDIYKATGAVIFNADGTTAASGHLGTQSAGGILQFNGFTGGSQEALGTLTPTAGHGQVVIGGTTTGSTLTFGALGTRGAGATLNLAPGGTSGVIFTTATTNTNGLIGGYATYGATGTDFAANVGAGGSAAAAPAGTALVAASNSATTNFLLSTGTVTLSTANASVNSLKLVGTAGVTTVGLNGVMTVTSGGVLFDNSAGTGLISGGTQLGAAASEVIVTTNGTTASNALTISSAISSTTGSLTKAGTGTLILSGASAFTGNVNINQGTVQLSTASGRIGTAQAAATVFNLRQGATFDLNGAGGGSTTIGALNGAGSIINSGTSTLVIGNGATTTVANAAFTGTIASAGLSLTKDGTGVQYLTGANTYGGVTQINRGTLAVTSLANGGSASSIGNSSNAAGNLVFNGGILQYTGSNTQIAIATQTPSVATDRLFTIATGASATIDSSGTRGNSFLEAGVANNASLAFTNTGDIAYTGAASAHTLTLTGSSTGDNELRPRITDHGVGANITSLTKTGAGLWILNPLTSNTYSGPTTVNGSAATTAGVLQFADDSGSVKGISVTSNIVLGAAAGPGVLQTSGSFTRAAGTGANQVQIGTIGGGFAASSSKLTVNLGGAGAALTFGAAPLNTSLLVLNSSTALAEVEIVNALNLGGAARTIQVDDNAATGTDLATISGVITNGSLNKSGGGILQLLGGNDYTGNTAVQNGALVVSTLGNATIANGPVTTTSSVGANGSQVQLGSGTATSGVLNYVGAGEVSDRVIALVSTQTGGGTIDSGGYGPLVLTSNLAVANGTATNTRTLTLRGYNSDNNEFRGAIADQGVNILTAVAKSDGGTWILSNNTNSYTGGTTISGGMLGIGAAGALGTGALNMNNATIFSAAGADLSLTNSIVTGGDANYTGDYSLNFSGSASTILASGATRTTRNTLAPGKTLTFSSTTINIGSSGGTGRTATFQGSGTTVLGGQIIDGTSVASGITINAQGGNVQFNNGTSTYTGTTTLTSGTVTAGATGTPFGTGTLAFNSAALTASTPVVLANPVTLGTSVGQGAVLTGTNSFEFTNTFGNVAATQILTNNLSGGATLTLGQLMMNTGADATPRVFAINGTGNTILNGSIQATAAAANNLTYSNSGTLSINTVSANGGSGIFTVNNGTVSLAAATQSALNFATIQLNGGTLSVDNQTNGNVAGRLGSATALNLNGGTFTFTANTAAGSVQNFGGTLAIGAGAATGGGASTLTFNNAGSSASTLTFTTLTPNQGGTLNINGTAALGAINKITFSGTAPVLSPVSTGILSRVTVGGTNFATYDAGNATLSAFSAYNISNNLDTAGATDTMEITSSTAIAGVNGILPLLSTTVNGLKLNGNGIAISANRPRASLTVTSGGLIATGATTTGATLSVPVLAFGTSEAIAHIDSNSGLVTTISSAITGSGGFTKTGSGLLTLSGQLAYTGQTTVNKGTLNLNSAIGTLPTSTSRTLSNLAVNEGATLNLGVNSAGNVQAFGTLQSSDPLSGKGGTINNSAASTVNLVSATATGTTFGGSITDSGGDLSFYKQGSGTLILTGSSSYAGSTNLYGGGLTLRDGGTLTSTTYNVNGGTLLLDNAGLSTVSQRIPTAATVNLRGGTLTYTGGNNMTETGSIATTGGAAVNALIGANTITANIGTGATTDLVIGNLVRSAGQGTVNFTTSGTTGFNGQANGRITLNQINGVAPVNGQFIGAWAIVGSSDYATYFNGNGSTSTGVGAYDSSGFNAYTTYSPLNTAGTYTVPTGILASGNISNLVANVTTTTFQMPGTLNVTDALRIGGGFTANVAFTNATDVLNLQQGGLLRSNNNNATTIGATAGSGILTAGTIASTTTELIVYNNQNTLTINSVIRDTSATTVGGSGTVSLVKSGGGTVVLAGNNGYSAGTTVQQGTLTLSTASANGTTTVSVPGNLTINNGATVNFGITTANSQIATTSNITINGGGTLTLPNYSVTNSNTWNSLTFNSNSGSAAPTVGFGTPTAVSTINLSAANAITVTNDNFAVTPIIAAAATATNSALRFTNTTGATVINVGGMAPEGLQITAPITTISSTSGLEKTGVGGLILSGANTYNNAAGLKLVDGSLILSNAAALGSNASPLVIGDTSVANTVPLTVMVGATAFTGTNAVTVNRDFTFGGLTSANNLTLAGAVTLAGAGARTITVTSPAVTGTITGAIGGSVGLSKDGVGTLVLGSTTNTNNYSGATTVSAGTLQISVAEQIPNASALTVASGALLNVNGLNETVGSLAGGGLILNPGAAMTLSTGGDNTSTTFSGIISNSTGSVLNFTKTGTGVQTLSAVNTYSGTTTITNGAIQLGISQALPNSLVGNSVAFNPASGTATLDLNGFSQTLGALTSTGAGTSAIDNTAAGAASVTIGALNQVVNFGGNITNSGGGALALTKTGSAAATLSGPTINYTGLTTVSAGSLSFTNATAPGLTGGVSVAGGATLNLNNTVGNVINLGSSAISLGSGLGTTILGYDLGLGDANPAVSINDLLTTTGTATTANTVQFNLTALGGFSAGTFNLISATSGLTSGGATYVIGSAPSGYNFAFNNTDSLIQIIATLQQDRYWKGLADNSWNTVNIAANYNWSALTNGSTDYGFVPSGTETVNFSADNAVVSGGGAITTTLDGSISIGNIKFLAGTNTTPNVTSVSIAQGTGGTLTLTPSSASDGILVNSNAGAISISAPVAVGSNQTWTVSATGASLDVSGAVSGGFGITKADSGTLTLSGAAANTYTGNTIVNAGSLILNKTAVDAIAAGTLQIGDSIGANDVDVVQLSGTNQINNVVNVDVRSTGLLNLNGNNETIAGLTLQSDVAQGASVTTGAGTLTIGGNVTLNANGTGVVGADITGSLNLNDAARTFTIAKGSANVTADLAVVGAISSTTSASGSIIKNGLGTLAFTGAANTYTGNTTVNAGVLALSKAASTDSIAGGTLIIGDGAGGNDADIAILTAAEQVNNSALVDVRSSGLFSLNGNAETIAGLLLQSDSAQGASVTTGAGSLILGGNVTHTASGTGAVNADITGSLNLNDAARTFTVAKGSGNTTFDLDLSGVISSTNAASGSLVKDGVGVMRLTGAGSNTFTGNTTVNAGTLLLSKTATINAIAGGTLIIGDSAGGNDADIVRLTAADQIANTVNVDIRSSGLFSLNGNNETVNVVTLQSDDTSAATITTGAGTLALSSNLNLNANNTGAVGADIVGSVNLNNAIRTFTIADGSTANTFDLDVNGVISSTTAATGGIIKAGAGTLRFTGAANTYTGLTTVNAGTLLLSKGAGVNAIAGALTIGDGTGGDNADVVRTTANEQLATAALTINSTGFLDMTGNTETIGALTLQSNTTEGASLVATSIVSGGTITLNAAGTGAVGADIVANFGLNDTARTFTIAKGSGNTTFDLDINGVINSATAASGSVVKGGAGTLRFSGSTSNSYTGLTTVNAGTLQLNKTGAAAAISGLLIVGTATNTAATVQYVGSGNNQMLTASNPSILGRGQLDFNGGTDTIGDISINNTGATTTNITSIANTAGGGNLTIGILGITPVAGLDTIIDTGSGGGTLTLGGTVTFTPATTGRAQFIGDNLALGGNRTFAIGLGTGTTYDVDISSPITGAFTVAHNAGGRLQYSGSTSNTYTGTTTVTAGSNLLLNKSGTANALAGNLTVGAANNVAATAQYTGASTDMIANTANVSVLGRGTLDINGKTDTVGNLTVTATGATGSTTPLINTAGGGNLTIGTLNLTPVAGGDTVLNVGATGTLTLGGTATFNGATTGRAQIIGGTVALGGNRDFNFAGTAGTGTQYDLDIQAAITGSGNTLTRLGTGGRLMFSGSAANTYDGLTSINGTGALILNKTAGTDAIAGDVTIGGGILRWLASNQIKDTSNVVYNSGSFDFTGGAPFSETIASLTINATPTFTGNSNLMVFTISGAANLTAGTTTLNSGTTWSSDSLVLTNAATLVSTGNSATTQSNWTVGSGGMSMSGQTVTLNNGAGATGLGSRITLGGGFTATGTNVITNSTATNGTAQIDLGGATRTFDITGTTTIQNNGNLVRIQNGGVTKTGTGNLILGGANTYAGATTISDGTLTLSGAGALSATSAVNLNGATAILDVSGVTPSSSSIASLAGIAGSSVVITGKTLNAGIDATSTTFAGVISGVGGNFNKQGSGTMILEGANTYDGTTTITGGVLQVGNGGTAGIIGAGTVSNNASLVFNRTDAVGQAASFGLISGSGSVTQSGAGGTLVLAGANSYTGKTVIANGTVSVAGVDAASANQPLGANTALDLGVASTSSGRLLYTGAAGTLGKNINALGNGSDTIENAGSGLLTLTGTITKAGTTLNLVGGASGILVTGTIVGAPASSDLVIGAGITTLAAANTYNGPTILNSGGTLNINNANAISTGAFTINGGTIDNTSGAAITLATNNPLNINSNFTFTGSNSLNLGTGAVTLDANRTVTVSANTLTIGGAISGGFNLIGAGAGTLSLTGASTYTGTTTAQTGTTISVGGNGALGDTSSGTTVDSGASLALNNVLYTDAEALTINGTGVGGGGALQTTGTSSFAGPITAATNATINNTGTLGLTGGLVKDGTTLTLAGSGTYNISGTGISGASANSDLIVSAATVNLNVANTYNGPTYIRNGGTLNANVTNALPTAIARTAIVMDDTGSGSSTLGLASNQSAASLTGAATSQIMVGASQLTVGAASGSTNFAGTIVGTGGSIVKDGASTQTLSGANTYSGGTTVNAGTLNVTNTTGSATGSGTVTVGTSGTLAGTGSITAAADNFIYINGTLQVGDSTLGVPTASSLEVKTSGTGSLVMGAASIVKLDLFTGAGLGDSSALSSAADQIRLFGSLDAATTPGSTLLLAYHGAGSFLAGDMWKLFDLTTGPGTIIGAFNVDYSGLGLGPLLGAQFNSTTGILSIVTVPEPSRALLYLIGLMGIFLRRRRQ